MDIPHSVRDIHLFGAGNAAPFVKVLNMLLTIGEKIPGTSVDREDGTEDAKIADGVQRTKQAVLGTTSLGKRIFCSQ